MKVINSEPLVDDWLCPEIVDRQSERKKIDRHIFKYLLEGKQPPGSYYVTGNSGSGKTFVFKRMFEDKKTQIKQLLPRFEMIYINAIDMRTPSSASIIREINKSIEHYLPITIDGETIDKIKNWKNAYIQMSILKNLIKGRKLNLVVIIDEVEKIVQFEKDDGLIYALANLRNEFIEKNYGIFTVFISNDKMLFKKLPLKTTSRIPFDDNFSNYQTNDLFDVLKIFSKYALDEANDEILINIANTIASTSASVRDAKRLLYNYIELEDMEKALNALDRDTLWDDLRKLNTQQRVVLVSILRGIKSVKDQQKRLIPTKYKENMLTSKRAYSIYCEFADNGGLVKKTSWRTFQRMLQSLRDTGVIRYEKISIGRGKGWAGKIDLERNVEDIEFLLKKAQD